MVVFLDFQEVFDTKHDILINKRQYYGVRGVPLNWFQSYLDNRVQQTLVKDYISETVSVTYGVSQDSVLVPPLFLVCINDSRKEASHSSMHHFVDDINIILQQKFLKKVIHQS